MKVILTRQQAKKLLKQIPMWLDEQFDEIVIYNDKFPEMVQYCEVRE